MIRQWEEFPAGPDDPSEMRITLGIYGDLLVNGDAFRKLGEPPAAVLLFDKLNELIGVKPANARTRNAYPFASKSTGRHRILFTSKFCRHYAIKLDRRVKFNDPEIDDDGILVLNLRTATAIGKPRMHKRREP